VAGGDGTRSRPAAAVLMRMSKSIVLLAGIALSSPVCVHAQQNQATDRAGEAASPSDIDGQTMFATSCGFCHQSGGRVAGKGPKLAGTTRSDDFIVQRIRNGKPGAMPAFGGAFSESQIMAIVAYIRTLEE
jgi:mono/diheme cytochrome c family protein